MKCIILTDIFICSYMLYMYWKNKKNIGLREAAKNYQVFLNH